MIAALLAALESLIISNVSTDPLTDFHRIEKVYNVLLPGSNPGTVAIKQKLIHLLQEHYKITGMLDSGFELHPQQFFLMGNDAKWAEWLQVMPPIPNNSPYQAMPHYTA